jgi:hypothetical protein
LTAAALAASADGAIVLTKYAAEKADNDGGPIEMTPSGPGLA